MASEQTLDSTEWFEAEASDEQNGTYILRLYVTGTTPKSLRAIANLKQICDEHLQGRYELEVIDLYKHPQLAAEDQIVAAPTLVKELPHPLSRMIGDLSDKEKVLVRLELLPKGQHLE